MNRLSSVSNKSGALQTGGSVLIWIFVVFLCVCNVQAGAVRWYKHDPIFLGTYDHAAKGLIPHLFQNILIDNLDAHGKHKLIFVPLEHLLLRDLNRHHNGMPFLRRNQILSANRVLLLADYDENAVQREWSFGRIYDIKFGYADSILHLPVSRA